MSKIKPTWSSLNPLKSALIVKAFGIILLVGLSALVLVIITNRGPDQKKAGPRARVCYLIKDTVVGFDFCTHGGDSVEAMGSQAGLCFPVVGCFRPSPRRTLSPSPSPSPTFTPSPSSSPTFSFTPIPSPSPSPTSQTSCSSEANSVQLIYGHPSDRPDRYSSWAQPIRDIASRMDALLGGRNIRFVCDANRAVHIWRVTLPPVTNNTYTFQEYISGVRSSAGGRSPKRAYLGFVSDIENEYPYGGQATLWEDDAKLNNANDIGPMYSMVDHLSYVGAMHELGHNLGAVQCSSAHSSCDGGSHHCWDENDIMCYADGTSHAMVRVCDVSTPVFDCKHDDYFNINPLNPSYLFSHWNLANSSFLIR